MSSTLIWRTPAGFGLDLWPPQSKGSGRLTQLQKSSQISGILRQQMFVLITRRIRFSICQSALFLSHFFLRILVTAVSFILAPVCKKIVSGYYDIRFRLPLHLFQATVAFVSGYRGIRFRLPWHAFQATMAFVSGCRGIHFRLPWHLFQADVAFVSGYHGIRFRLLWHSF